MRKAVGLVTVLVVAATLSGCGAERQKDATIVLNAITATERLARRYTYTDVSASGQRSRVDGLVEDDFRHKERLTVDGEIAADEVVSDDAIAVRITSDQALARLVNRNPIPDIPTAVVDPKAPTLADSLAALKQHRWVLDPSGAPPLVRSNVVTATGEEREPTTGDDALVDAVDVFNYVRRAISGSFEVKKFNPDDINYKPSEDPFEKPPLRGPVERYDLVRPFLPVATLQTGGRPNLPGPQNFRKMAVYLRDGRVVKIAEELYPAERLNQTIDRTVAFLKKAGASERILSRTRALKDAPDRQASIAIVGALNVLRERNNDAPIRLRSMRLTLSEIGSKQLHAVLPLDAVRGPLDVLKNRGRTAGLPAANKSSGGAGATTTTTAFDVNSAVTTPGETTTTSAPPP